MRGGVLLVLAALQLAAAVWAQPEQKRIDFDAIIRLAQERAAAPFNPATHELPEELRGAKLNYDTYREIRFRHDRALWLKEELPFRLEFFHPGYLYQTPVAIHEFNATHVQPVRFVQDFFDYGKLNLPKIPADTGYAGFRLLYPLNSPERWDELASFLGASYFRCLGKGLSYGQSARGLALNCGDPEQKEEFPTFTAWWLGKPEKQSKTLRFYGLLESSSCTGAYEFLLRPADSTFVDIEAVLFLRPEGAQRVKTMGLAPLTSMFWFGENSWVKADDYRAEVHDSDGLLIRTAEDQLTWRPLDNPTAPRHQTFAVKELRGFGLLQRDRQFANYQDLFNPYHRVPSVWIEPRGKWPEGEVHLVELPSKHEGEDNIVTFWKPSANPEPLQPYRFAYTLNWTGNEPHPQLPLLRVTQTRSGSDPRDSSKRQFVIDFTALTNRPAQVEVSPHVELKEGSGAAVSDIQVFKNGERNGWRVFFSIKPDAAKTELIHILCSLRSGEKTVSEGWNYLWNPSQPTKKSP